MYNILINTCRILYFRRFPERIIKQWIYRFMYLGQFSVGTHLRDLRRLRRILLPLGVVRMSRITRHRLRRLLCACVCECKIFRYPAVVQSNWETGRCRQVKPISAKESATNALFPYFIALVVSADLTSLRAYHSNFYRPKLHRCIPTWRSTLATYSSLALPRSTLGVIHKLRHTNFVIFGASHRLTAGHIWESPPSLVRRYIFCKFTFRNSWTKTSVPNSVLFPFHF